jgi:hypothetical protein
MDASIWGHRAGESHAVTKPQASSLRRVRVSGKYLHLSDHKLEHVMDILAKLKTGSQGILAWYRTTNRYNPADRTP